ncbi:MAG TPA: two-component sensor histidine kinase, partial [Clostridiales bacterium]|nr:two-component sensor histidine kinase [Clostridiales bacterium]
KYESGALTLDKTEFNLKELVKRVVGNFEKEFLSKNIQLELKLDKQIIKADRDKISQMIVNLISNALKYTNAGGKVIIELTGDNNKAELAVIDNGIGIAEEDLPYIFERFYRADKSRTRLTGGAGIGLAITKAIVEAHKGTIEVESEINVGTKFKVILPKNNEEI